MSSDKRQSRGSIPNITLTSPENEGPASPQIDRSNPSSPSYYSSEALCEIYQCAGKLESAEATLTTWIEDNLNGDTISEIAAFLEENSEISDPHNIRKEGQDLVQIIQQFYSDLCNMFDNYVCFFGNEDYKQMSRFLQVAKGRAKDALKKKNHVHHQFTDSLLKKCGRKLVAVFREDNANIIHTEDMLTTEIYVQILEAYYDKIKKTLPVTDPDKLEAVHGKIRKQCVTMMTRSLQYSGKLNSVSGSHIKELDTELAMHFYKIMETMPKHQVPKTGSEAATVSLCIHLASNGIRVGTSAETGNKYLKFGPNDSLSCPTFLALTDTDQFLYGYDAVQQEMESPSTIYCKGSVIHYVTSDTEDETVCEGMLRVLFQNLMEKAEKALKPVAKFTKVHIVIPDWFTEENRETVLGACQGAKFKETFILSEASLAAEMIFSQTATLHQFSSFFTLVVIMTEEQVEVRIYRKGEGQTVPKLIALGQAFIPDLRKRIYFGDKLEEVIQEAYKNALEQIGDVEEKHKRKVCAEICEFEDWRGYFKTFLEQRHDIVRFQNGVRDDSHILNVAINISKQPTEEINSIVLDHGMEMASDDEDDEEHSDYVTESESDELVEEDEQEVIEMIRDELEEKCAIIRTQIENESAQLPVLSRKLVIGSLDDIENNIRNNNAMTMEDLELQRKEVDELISQYNFKC